MLFSLFSQSERKSKILILPILQLVDIIRYNYNNVVLEGHMEINVSQQLKAAIGTLREYDVEDNLDILAEGVNSPVKGTVNLTRTNRGILVQGKLETSIPFECSRCLNTYQCSLTINIEEEYFPVIDVNSGTALEIPDEIDSFRIDEHHILDLNEVIRQNALLAIPMKPLCREDCPGFCPECGQDLTKGQCKCKKGKIDPRWLKLIGSESKEKIVKNIKKTKME
jgi:uncharacterized protein